MFRFQFLQKFAIAIVIVSRGKFWGFIGFTKQTKN